MRFLRTASREYRKTAQSGNVVPTLESAGTGLVERRSLLLVAGGPTAGVEMHHAMRHESVPKREIFSEEAFGSSQRVYFDTPPLLGAA
jgi:hypothetical protein